MLPASVLHKKSAEMDIKLLPRRSFKKPLSFGHFEWEDEMEVKEINGHRYAILCASYLEIFEHGDIAHVLAFDVSIPGNMTIAKAPDHTFIGVKKLTTLSVSLG